MRYNQVQSGTIRYQWVPVYQVPVYQVYQEDRDQISDATYISDVVFLKTKNAKLPQALGTPLSPQNYYALIHISLSHF